MRMRSVPALRPRVDEDAMRIEEALHTRVTPLDADVMKIESLSEVLQLTMTLAADTDAMGIGIVPEALLRGTRVHLHSTVHTNQLAVDY